jgi:3-methyl-2-oxobutanoate hydroxymethyltransferase
MAVTISQLQRKKQQGQKFAVLTAWDFLWAQWLDRAGVEVILVGDSLAMVALGYPHTLPVDLDAMVHHGAAVCRGVSQALVVCDLPFLTYQESPVQALRSAGRILKETGAQGVKLEGGYPQMLETVARLTQAGIPVMGHVGLTPQSVHHLGYRQQGKTPEAADRIVQEAQALEAAGAFSIVLEHIPAPVAQTITQTLTIPTIGIGAGPHCDGQVLVTADLLGLTDNPPPFAPVYAELGKTMATAIARYVADVQQGQFPPQG